VKWPKAPISALLAVLYFPAVVVETLGFAWTQGSSPS
jgi:hypothetical protein